MEVSYSLYLHTRHYITYPVLIFPGVCKQYISLHKKYLKSFLFL